MNGTEKDSLTPKIEELKINLALNTLNANAIQLALGMTKPKQAELNKLLEEKYELIRHLRILESNLQNHGKFPPTTYTKDSSPYKIGDKVEFVIGWERHTGKIILDETDNTKKIQYNMNARLQKLYNDKMYAEYLNQPTMHKTKPNAIVDIEEYQKKIIYLEHQIANTKETDKLEELESELKQNKDELNELYPKEIIDISKAEHPTKLTGGGRKRRSKRAVKTRKPKRRIRRSRRKHSRSSHRK
jgi:hypothetical protein